MDLFEDDTATNNTTEYTVSEISGAVKKTIEGGFAHVRVRAEVGRVSRPRSGHVYFDLKDDRAVLAAVSWKGQAARLEVLPEEGMEVIATGRLTTFPGQSKYQMIVEDVRPAGMGALMAMLEKRKKALEAEGLFDPARKKALPFLPEVIGVVTSPSGAVIRDILHRLRDRFPRKVLVWPVAVQGKTSAGEVAAAIRGFDAMTPGGALPRPDLLIVARGGGSIEDLWGFNEEEVARAVADCTIPLISAVGHETDTTLIDYVADRRAPTPTAAAEMAVPVRLELLSWAQAQGGRLLSGLDRVVRTRRQRLADLSRALPRTEALLADPRQRLDRADDALPKALTRSVEMRRARLGSLSGALRPAALTARIAEARRSLGACDLRLIPSLTRGVRAQRNAFDQLSRRVRSEPLQEALRQRRERLAAESRSLDRVQRERIERLSTRLVGLERMRLSLGYVETLKRGYAVVRAGEDVVTTVEAARRHAALEIEFADGRIETRQAGGGGARKSRDEPGGQGSLF